jgi:predicted hydrocarbon binding protein
MHGLIFVTWEKYLSERFPDTVFQTYRHALGETPETAPLASRVYSDEMLLAGVTEASRITKVSADMLLREFGRYFLLNGLTRHLCAYLLTRVNNARDLLLTMHDAHEQMSRLPDGLTPPLFQYRIQPSNPHSLIILYDSPRKLCSVLHGAIEGAAERYGDQVYIVEQTCMKRGDKFCRFKVHFVPSPSKLVRSPEQRRQQQTKREFASFVLEFLPEQEGVTLAQLQERLIAAGETKDTVRPALLIVALYHLHHAGLVATSANQPGDQFNSRRYWRAPTTESFHDEMPWPGTG